LPEFLREGASNDSGVVAKSKYQHESRAVTEELHDAVVKFNSIEIYTGIGWFSLP